jgi:hypothetical protein
MKTIFILSTNKLGFTFWKSRLNIAESCQVMEFQSGSACIKSLNLQPDVVIIDDRFPDLDDIEPTGEEVAQIIGEILPHLRGFHVSSLHVGKEWSLEEPGMVRSDLNPELIAAIKSCVQTNWGIAA